MNRFRVIARALELRAGPGTNYEVLEQLPAGEPLEQVPSDPHWTRVRRVSDGRIGWVYNAYIRPIQPVAGSAPATRPAAGQAPAAGSEPAQAMAGSPSPAVPAPATSMTPASQAGTAAPAPDDAAGADLAFDISHFQPNVDFAAARQAGLRAVFHKATEGLHEIDPCYAAAREQARAAGLLWGAYHFGTGEDALAQAAHFLDIAKPDGATLLVLDLETNPQGASMSIEQARTFVSHVRQVTGKWPGLYSGSYIRDHLGNQPDPVLGNCWFWLAEYGPVAHVPPTWDAWTFWQHTDGHVGPGPYEVPGAGPVDRDRFAGDEQALAEFWAANA
jgi:lysozyme